MADLVAFVLAAWTFFEGACADDELTATFTLMATNAG